MFVVETILSSQFPWVSVFSSSNLSLKHAYINFSRLSIACCVSRYVQLRAIIYRIPVTCYIVLIYQRRYITRATVGVSQREGYATLQNF